MSSHSSLMDVDAAHAFDSAVALTSLGGDLWQGHTSPAYGNMVGPFGGVTAAQALNAVLMHPQRLGDPVSLTVNFAAGLADGAFVVEARPARPLDFASLAALADVFFPRVWVRRAKPVPIGTVSMTVYFHAGAAQLQATGTGYLLGQAQAQAFHGGFFDQSAQLWNEAGELLATTHQMVYYKE